MNPLMKPSWFGLWMLAMLLTLGHGAAQAQLSCSWGGMLGTPSLDINFGTVNQPTDTVDITSAAITINCTNGSTNRVLHLCVGLSSPPGGGSVNARRITNGSNLLLYRIYRNAARTQILGNAPNQMASYSTIWTTNMAGDKSTNIRLYARLNNNQTDKPPGLYDSTFAPSNIIVKWDDYANDGSAPGAITCGALSKTMNATSGFTVKANVQNSCSITSTPEINFGIQSVPFAGDIPTSGTLSVRCTNNLGYSIAASNGQNGNRRMRLGATNNYIRYDLCREPFNNSGICTSVWGTQVNRRFGGTGTGNNQGYVIHALIRSNQGTSNTALGEYTDMVTVTLEY